MQYRPLVVSRVAHTVLGVIPTATGIGLFGDGPDVWRVGGGAALVTIGAYVVIRALRLGVEVARGHVVTRGLLWSRRIPAASVSHVTDFPAIVWEDDRGRRRWTPLVGLMSSSRMLDFAERHNREQVARLSRALRRHR